MDEKKLFELIEERRRTPTGQATKDLSAFYAAPAKRTENVVPERGLRMATWLVCALVVAVLLPVAIAVGLKHPDERQNDVVYLSAEEVAVQPVADVAEVAAESGAIDSDRQVAVFAQNSLPTLYAAIYNNHTHDLIGVQAKIFYNEYIVFAKVFAYLSTDRISEAYALSGSVLQHTYGDIAVRYSLKEDNVCCLTWQTDGVEYYAEVVYRTNATMDDIMSSILQEMQG